MRYAVCRGALCAGLVTALLMPSIAMADPLSARLEAATAVTAQTYRQIQAETPQGQYPFYTYPNGSWAYAQPRRWVSGFLPGAFWLEYQATGDATFKSAALARQQPLAPYATDTGLHDLGFMFMPTFGAAYRLTGDASHRNTLIAAATSLGVRYDPVVGMVRTWDTPKDFYVYNDTMMNLELLFYAANVGGSPRLREMAARHATTTMRDFIRADGSTYHYVAYDESTGRALDKGQGQGYAKESTWARGQAWMIYGLTVAFRETGDTRYLDGLERTFDYWKTHVPSDLVPYWDFNAPDIPAEPRDTSAAAIVASACMELGQIHPGAGARKAYAEYGLATLGSLSGPEYLSAGQTDSVLMHGTYAAMSGAADHGTSWGDYYYLEALTRAQSTVQRVSGTNRYLTAVRASQITFDAATDVVICSGAGYADALSAAGLAGRLDAPILLVSRDSVGADTLAEIRRLGARRAVIVGGSAAVGDAVARSLKGVGVAVERVAGVNRYATAQASARFATQSGTPAMCYVVRGDDYADALAVAPLAYEQGASILLADPDRTPWEALAVIREQRPGCVRIVGGPQAVGWGVQHSIKTLGVGCERIAGADRYDTAACLAQSACAESGDPVGSVGIATGQGYADALVGGAMLGRRGGVLLLVEPRSIPQPAYAFLKSETGPSTQVFILGGEGALSGLVENRVRAALGY